MPLALRIHFLLGIRKFMKILFAIISIALVPAKSFAYEAITIGALSSTVFGLKQKLDCEKERAEKGTKGPCNDIQDRLNEEKVAEEKAQD
jgi:hypothetical protein